MSQTESIDRARLIAQANEMIVQHEHYFEGMTVTDVEQNGDVLVFRGDYFLDDNGLPTAKSTQVFNVFKSLAQALSSRYRLTE